MENITNNYEPPVDQLLTYGEAELADPDEWPNYLELGLGSAQVPELIRMATDEDLSMADAESLDVWAPVHAWRALGQLRAEEAVEPLLSLLQAQALEDNDWAMEELPEVLAMFGPAVLPALAAYIADLSYNEYARISAIGGIEKIGVRWPEARLACVEILMKQLGQFDKDEFVANGFLVIGLIHLHATEAASVIEQAFDAGYVDTSIVGDWEDVQFELGLLPDEELERRRAEKLAQEERAKLLFDRLGLGVSTGKSPLVGIDPQPSFASIGQGNPPQPSFKERRQHEASHQKAKSKMAKQSRKKNRKR